jgi:hypothetical protein
VKTGSLSASLLYAAAHESHAMQNATNAATGHGMDDIEESLRSPLLSDPLVLPVPMTTTETHSLTSDEPEVLPLWSSFIATTQFWWKIAKVPFLFVIFNLVAISFLLSEIVPHGVVHSTIIDGEDTTTTTTTSKTIHPAFVQMRKNSTQMGILFLFNTPVLYRGALSIEQQIYSMRRRRRRQESSPSNEDADNNSNNNNTADAYSSSSSLDDSTHALAKISQTIDMFLCRGRASQLPEVSFFVNVLFLVTALSLVVTAVSFSVSAFLYSSKASLVCTYQATELKDIKGVPDSLLQWISSDSGRGDGVDESQIMASSYVHLNNGMTYFAGTNRTLWEEKYNSNNKIMTRGHNNFNNDYDDDLHNSWKIKRKGGLGKELFSAGPDGTLISYPQIGHPHYFTKLVVVSGSKERSQSELFCCIYISKELTDKLNSWERTLWGGWPSVLCMGGEWTDDDQAKKQLRTIGLPIDAREERFMEDYAVRGYEGTWWIRIQCYLPQVGGRHVKIYKLDPHTMNLTVVASTYPEGAMEENGYIPCFDWINAVRCIVGAPLLLLMAYWQLKFRDIPAGMASLCLGPLVVMIYLDAEWAARFVALASVGATISLFSELPPWMSRDMVHWGMYTSLAVLVVMLESFDGEQYSILCLCVIIGVVLNHPVLQIMGWLFGAVTLFFALLDLNAAGILVCLVVSCGFLRLGVSLDKHRPYLVYYSRRLTRILNLAARNSLSTGQGRGGTVTRHPHSNVAAAPFLNTRDD